MSRLYRALAILFVLVAVSALFVRVYWNGPVFAVEECYPTAMTFSGHSLGPGFVHDHEDMHFVYYGTLVLFPVGPGEELGLVGCTLGGVGVVVTVPQGESTNE